MTIIDRRYSVAEGLAVKAPCRVATTANITLSGLQTIDGVTVVDDDRVLVKNQTTGSENGIYTASSGNWTRTRDFDGAYDIVTGTRVFVTLGTVNASSEYYVSTTGTITVDSTSIAFSAMPAGNIAANMAAAAASATAAANSESAAATSETNAAASATAAANSAASIGANKIFASRAALVTATVDASVSSVLCLGYAAAGDCAPILLNKVASPPRYGGVQSADGTWWVYVPGSAGVDARAFGYKSDWDGTDASATNNATALQNAINFAALEYGTGFDTGGGGGSDVLLPSGSAKIGSIITVHDGVRVVGKGTYGTILKMDDTFSTSSHMFRLGTPGDSTAVCALQSKAGAGDLTINGTFASGGIATFLQKRIVSVYSSGNDTGVTFTIYGTNETGASINETVTGTNGSHVDTTDFFATITRVAASGATAGNVTVGYQTRAAFGSRLESLQLWSDLDNAASGMAMVYTNNAQHTAGLKCVKIFGGNRHCALFETGVGGASYFMFEDVETFNHGNTAGVASNNSQIKLNYAGLLTSIRNIVMGGPGATGGAGAIGLQILGGNVIGETIHSEGIATGIIITIPSVNEGTVQLRNVNGNPTTTNLIHIDAVTDNNTVVLSSIFGNGSTATILDDPAGGTTTAGNIIPWTTY